MIRPPSSSPSLLFLSALALGVFGGGPLGCSDDSTGPEGMAGSGGKDTTTTGGTSSGGTGSGTGGGTGGLGGSPGGQEEVAICPEGPFGLPHAAFAATTEEMPALAAATELELTFAIEGEEANIDLEGPVWSSEEGALFFSDKNPPWAVDSKSWQDPASGTIWKLEPGKTPVVHVLASGSNGLALAVDGNLLAATHSNRNLTRYDIAKPDTVLGTVLDDPEGDNNTGVYNSPNDLTVSSTGHVYFTDPSWQNSQPKDERPAIGAYWVDPEGNVTQFSTKNTNGVSLSPDEKTLYLGIGGKIEAWEVAADGEPQNPTDFAPITDKWADGFAVDCAGNLYVTQFADGAGGVVVWSPAGVMLGMIDVGGTATNAAFGGPDRKTLYITRSGGLYSIELDVPGYPY